MSSWSAAGSPAPASRLDAASRGLSVALLERRDLAFGTSRWSSKLVHGGLRYLQHGEWGLAWECAVERATLHAHDRAAPRAAAAVPDPARRAVGTKQSSEDDDRPARRRRPARRPPARAAALLPPPRRVSALEARRLAPALRPGGLRGALLSWDGQLEDDARLVVAVARTAAAHGARMLTYAEVTGLREDGVEAVDALTGAGFIVRARRTVVAAGVWTGALTAPSSLRPSRGSHLLVPAARLGEPRAAVNVPVPGEHGRWVFALPRSDGLVAIGLTDVRTRRARRRAAAGRGRGGRAARPRLRRAGHPARPGRRLRPLRRPAPARRRRRRDRRPLAPPPDRRGPERRARHRRRQAHHVPPHGPGRRRPAHRPPVPHGAAAAGRRRAARRAALRRGARSGSCAATAPRRRPSPRSPTAARSCSSSSRPGVPVCGAELLWAARHELALTVVGPRRPPGAGGARAGVAGRGGRGGRARSGSTPRRHEPRACREAGSSARDSVSTLPTVCRFAARRQSRHDGEPARPIHQPPLPSRSSPAPSIRPHGLPRAADHRPARSPACGPTTAASRGRTASSPTPASTSSASTAGCIVAGPATRAHLDDRERRGLRRALPHRRRRRRARPARRRAARPQRPARGRLGRRRGAPDRGAGDERARARRGGRCGGAARPTRSSAPPPPARRATRSGSATASSGAASSTPSATARRRSSGSSASSASCAGRAANRPRAARARRRLRRPGAPHARVHAARRTAPGALLADGAGPAGERSVSFKTDARAPATMAA